MQIFGMILTVIAIFIAIKIARKVVKIIFTLIALIGIAMSLYGDQIISYFLTLISKGG